MPIQGYEFKVLEKKLTCPFNPAHQVTDMQKHLTRCSLSNASNVNVKRCPFNATHYVKAPEFTYHLDHCEDRAPVDRHMLAQLSTDSGNSGDLSMPLTYSARNVVENPLPGWDDGNDDWDVEVSNLPAHMRTKYDPKEATKDREIFRHPTEHRGKSGRGKFRAENNLRMQGIQNGSVADEQASSTLAPSVSTTVRRRPTTNPICCQNMAINPNMGMGRARRPAAAAALPAAGATGGDTPPAPTRGRGRGRGAASVAPRLPGLPGSEAGSTASQS